MLNGSRPSHALRIAIFILRLALGVDFFYLGFSILFSHALAARLAARSVSSLYQWVGIVPHAAPLQTAYAWAFMIIGACMVLGLMTRIAALAAAALSVLSFLPAVSISPLDLSSLANDGLLAAAGCLVLFLSRAGEYIGLDKFLHIRFSGRSKE